MRRRGAHSRFQSAFALRVATRYANPQLMRVLIMVVGLKPTSNAVANYLDNLCRWDRRSANHYEVWFLTLNHIASNHGFWFRYTMESPSNQEPKVALWAAAFNRRKPESNIGLKREYEVEQFAFE